MMSYISFVNTKLNPAEILLEPDVSDFKSLDFHRADEAIKCGFNETHGRIAEIQKEVNTLLSGKGKKVIIDLDDNDLAKSTLFFKVFIS